MDLDASFAQHFVLDPGVDYLNHGSFGACPRSVLDAQTALREELERNPTRFLARELEGRIDAARLALSRLLDAEAEGLVFVPNTTSGVNTVLASLALDEGDELLTTDHAYNACRNTLTDVAERAGARVVVAAVPFPLSSEDEVVTAIDARVTRRTRLLLVDHITSPTGLVLPVSRIVRSMHERGVAVLVDGAHAPGQLPVSLRALGADYYTGNCHKWLCTPKGSAFLHVSEKHAGGVRPLVTSHGRTSRRTDRPRLWLEHDWVGTVDPTPFLCIPAAIAFLESLLPGGLPALQARNRALALHARALLCDALSIAPPAPEGMVGALAAVPLPPSRHVSEGARLDALQDRLREGHQTEVIVSYFPAAPARVVRISAQAYNSRAQYERLAAALVSELALERSAASPEP